jgi:hypothetical protein
MLCVSIVRLEIVMAKMASLDAEQKDIPWEYLVWKRLAMVMAGVWVLGVVGLVTLIVAIAS